jgi:malate dehydrogenase
LSLFFSFRLSQVSIWGNHSATQFPDVNHAVIVDYPKAGDKTPVREAVKDDAYLDGDFIKVVQQRGAAVIAARKLSSAMSAAKAIADHVRDWHNGTAVRFEVEKKNKQKKSNQNWKRGEQAKN